MSNRDENHRFGDESDGVEASLRTHDALLNHETVDTEDVLRAFHEKLVQNGLKATKQRELIVETFFNVDRHVSVDDLLLEVRKRRKSTGYATVYRTLKLLVELGFANERHFGGADASTLYDPLYGRDEHFHLICSDCNNIVEFEDASLDARVRELAAALGFPKVVKQTLELYAECGRTKCPNRTTERTDS